MSRNRETVVVGAVSAVVWLAKAVFVIATPLRRLVMTPYLIDDSFIFMHIARNLARGRGFSYDGLHPTTGAPLAWTLLITPQHWWLDKTWAAKVTVVESALFAALSAVMVFLVARRLFGRRSAWFAFGLATFGASLFFNALNGMETYLFAFVALLALHRYVVMDRARWREWALLGALLGLLNLIRAEGVFLGACVLGYEGLRVALTSRPPLPKPGEGEPDGSRLPSLPQGRGAGGEGGWSRLATFTLAWLLFTIPMLAWNVHVNGTLTVSNQAGRRFIAHLGFSLAQNGWGAYFQICLSKLRELYEIYDITLGFFPLALVALGWLLWRRDASLRWLAPFLGYWLLFCALLVFYQWYFPNVHGLRYVVFSSLVLAIVTGAMVGGMMRKGGRIGLVVGVAVLAACVGLSWWKYGRMMGQLSWTRDFSLLATTPADKVAAYWEDVDWIAANTPPQAVIAVKDHGLLAYFTGRRVADLAGIMDPSVIGYLKARNLAPYLRDHDADYVILYTDPHYYLNQAVDLASGHYTLVKSFADTRRLREIYRIEKGPWVKAGAGAEPQVPLNVELGGQVRLLGYSWLGAEGEGRSVTVRPGDTVGVTLLWAALAPLERDYSVFVHVTEPSGRPVAQTDHQPQDGFYPTSTWRVGEVMREEVRITIPPDTPPGRYALTTGMYSLDTMERLAVAGGDTVVLGEVRVVILQNPGNNKEQ